MWKAQHESGKREINTLHVPVGQPVRLTLTSEDVLHDFFIPAFRVKKDVIPGRYTTMWFEASKVGEYHLFCAEYCGTQHSYMVGKVYAMEPGDYHDWLLGGPMASESMEESVPVSLRNSAASLAIWIIRAVADRRWSEFTIKRVN